MNRFLLAATVVTAGLILAGCNAEKATTTPEVTAPVEKVAYDTDLNPKAVALGLEEVLSEDEENLKDEPSETEAN